MKLRHLTLMIIVLFVIIFIRYTKEEEEESIRQVKWHEN
jgi:hypothetical protein